MSAANCPVLVQVEKLMASGGELARAMRQLRERVSGCEACDLSW